MSHALGCRLTTGICIYNCACWCHYKSKKQLAEEAKMQTARAYIPNIKANDFPSQPTFAVKDGHLHWIRNGDAPIGLPDGEYLFTVRGPEPAPKLADADAHIAALEEAKLLSQGEIIKILKRMEKLLKRVVKNTTLDPGAPEYDPLAEDD